MKLHEYSENGADIMELSGEIDLHYAPVLRSLLAAKTKSRCPALLLDLTGVKFIDSSGLAVLLEYLRDCGKFEGRFFIAGMSQELGWIFETTKLQNVMPLFWKVSDAKAALAANRLPQPPVTLFEAA